MPLKSHAFFRREAVQSRRQSLTITVVPHAKPPEIVRQQYDNIRLLLILDVSRLFASIFNRSSGNRAWTICSSVIIIRPSITRYIMARYIIVLIWPSRSTIIFSTITFFSLTEQRQVHDQGHHVAHQDERDQKDQSHSPRSSHLQQHHRSSEDGPCIRRSSRTPEELKLHGRKLDLRSHGRRFPPAQNEVRRSKH